MKPSEHTDATDSAAGHARQASSDPSTSLAARTETVPSAGLESHDAVGDAPRDAAIAGPLASTALPAPCTAAPLPAYAPRADASMPTGQQAWPAQGSTNQFNAAPAASHLRPALGHSPGNQVRPQGIFAQTSVGMAPVPGVDPASLPFATLLTSPPAPTAPPAMHASMGGHPMVYVVGHGLVPVAPIAPAYAPSGYPTMPGYGSQSAYASGMMHPAMPPATHPAATHVASMAPTAAHPAAAHPAAAAPPAGNIPQGYTVGISAAAISASANEPRVTRDFPQLSSFKSLEELYQVVTKGDPMSGTSSFAAMTAANPEWRKGESKRLFEIESAVKEMTERAAAESKQTGHPTSPLKHAKLMDAERVEHGRTKGKGKPTPVASWVKTVLGPMRASRNRQSAGEP